MNRRAAAMLAIPIATLLSTAAAAQAQPDTRRMLIGTAATATVKEELLGPGVRVNAGELLVALDCRPIEAELEARRALLASSEALAERARNGPRVEEIAVAEAAVGYSTARAEEARKTFERAQALREGVSVTQARVLETQRDARITAAQLEEARARLALLRAGTRVEEVADAKARRDAAAAQVAETQARLDQCFVRAPVDGAVVEIFVTPGQLVSAAVPTPLLSFAPAAPPR
jgi:multidrug resistance efflux pump